MNKKWLEELGLTAEVLKAANLPDDFLDKIIIEHGKGIEAMKQRVANQEDEVKSLGEQLEAANAKIKTFEAMKPEELKASVAEWQAEAEKFKAAIETAKAEAEARVKDVEFNYKLSDTLRSQFKAKDPADVIPHLKRDQVSINEDGTFVGLKEQMENLLEAKSYLFDADTDDNPRVKLTTQLKNSQNVGGDAVIAAAREAAGVSSGGDK